MLRKKLKYARHREMGSVPSPARLYEVKTTSAGAKTVTDLGQTYGNGEWSWMNDVVTPGWNAKGTFVMNPMQRLYRNQYGGGSGYLIRQKSNGDQFECGGDIVRFFSGPLLKVASGVAQPVHEASWGNPQCQMAIAEAATKAQRVPSDANVLVTMAELRKTREMLPNLLSSWTQFFNRLSNKRFWAEATKLQGRNVASSSQTMMDLADQVNTTYLMARFGLRPLIMDTQGVINAVQRAHGAFLRERKTARGTVQYSESTSGSFTGVLGILRTPMAYTATHNVEIRAMQVWEQAVDAIRDAGLSVEQIPEAAIDLVRYSFVVNWMVNVNDYASALANMYSPTWNSIGSCLVAKREIATTVWTTGVSSLTQPAIYELLTGPSGIATVTVASTGRSVGLPAPALTVRARPLRWMEDARLADAVGLLRNALRPHQQNLNQLAQLRAAQLRSHL